MEKFRMILLLYFVYFVGVESQGQQPAGYKPDEDCSLIFTSGVHTCSDDNSKSYMDTSGIEATQLNETTAVMSGEMKLMGTFDNSTRVKIVVQKKNSGQFQPVFTIEINNFCEEIEKPESQFRCYLQRMSFGDKCPVGPGGYLFQNLVADTSNLPVNQQNMGDYMVTVNVYEYFEEKSSQEFRACSTLECRIDC